MHLVVRHGGSDEIVGACRIRVPHEALWAGGYRLEEKFDLDMLDVLRDRMVEVSGVQVHPDHGSESILPRLGTILARFLVETRHDYVLASACVSLMDGGHNAASTYRDACIGSLSPEDLRIYPRERLALERLRDTLPATPSPLLKAYLALGAWICGEPAWDREFDRADFPILLPLARMRGRFARHFLAKAA
jgi:putative hemolysin